MSELTTCPACGNSNPAEAKFCGSCGAALVAVCPRCEHRNPSAGAFCTECGAALATPGLEDRFSSPQTYTPSRLAEKILAEGAEIKGERKQITVLFADVAGFTSISEKLDPEETHLMMQRCFDLMLEEVHGYEGTVSQFLGDGMLALFGAPISHEDHAQRAIRAGLGIQLALKAYEAELAERGIDFRVRIGLNSGTVVVDSVGVDLTMNYLAVGDTVNTASRMESLAPPGSVVVSENTHRLAEGYFVFRDLGPHDVKGKAEAIRVYEVLEPSRSRSRVDVVAERGLGPLVGRRGELDTLVERFNEARLSDGRVIFVSGEAGLGKSRLLYELRRRLEGEDLAWFVGRCISYGTDISYLPVIDLLKDAFGIEESDDDEEVDRKLTEGALESGAAPDILPYLRYLLSIDPRDDTVASGDPQLRKARLFEALAGTLVGVADSRPVVITIEDLHWIDQLSAEFLSFLADAVPEHRLLVLLTHRPDWDPPFGDRPYFSRIHLEALSEQESMAVAESTLGAGGLPPGLRDLISRKAEGNPFFVEEVVKSLAEAGVLRRSNSHYELAKPIEEIFVPDTVQDVIMARLDRLPEDPRRALQTASVIGREFTARLLDRTAGLGSASEDSLSELKSVQLIYERTLYPELAFMFKHALTHEVAYGSLLMQRRKLLHGLVGDAIRELYADRLPEHYETLAHHYEHAERWVEALDYLMKSSEKSLGAFAPQAAVGFLDRALTVLGQPGVTTDRSSLVTLHSLRGQAHELMSESTQSISSYEAMLAAAREAGDRDQEGVALYSASYALFWAHRFEEAVDLAEQARSLAEETGNAAVLAGSVRTIAFVRAVIGDIEAATSMLEDVVRLARDAGEPTLEALALDMGGEVWHWRGEENRAIDLLAEGLQIGRTHEIPAALLWILWDRSLALCGVGRYEDAMYSLNEVLELSRRVDDRFVRCRALNTLGWVHMDLCNWEVAIEHNRMAAEESRALGDPEIIRNSDLNLADCRLAIGELDEAASLLASVERESAQTGAWGEEFMKWRYTQHLKASFADYWLARDDPARALEYAGACIAAAEATGAKRNIGKGRRARAEALMASGKLSQAEEDVETALRMTREIGNPAQIWKTLAVQARIRAAQGRAEEAAAAYRGALDTIESVAEGLADPGQRATMLASDQVAALRREAAERA